MKFCMFCGNKLEDYAVFCSRCGKKVLRAQSADAQEAEKDTPRQPEAQPGTALQPEAPADAITAANQEATRHEQLPVTMPRQYQYQNIYSGSTNDTAGLVLGIIALVMWLIYPPLTSIIALVLGIIGACLSSKAQRCCRTAKATAGKTTSIIAIVLSSLILLFWSLIAAAIIEVLHSGSCSKGYYDLARAALPYLI